MASTASITRVLMIDSQLINRESVVASIAKAEHLIL